MNFLKRISRTEGGHGSHRRGGASSLLAIPLALGILALSCAGAAAQLDAASAWPMFQHDARHTGLSPHAGPVWGRLAWSYEFEGDYLESQPSVGPDGTVYIGTYDNNVTALTSAGALAWSYATDSSLDSVPAVSSDGTLYVGSHDNNVYALTSRGALSWSYNTRDSVRSSPVIGAGGDVYVCSTKRAFAFSAGGSIKWSYAVTGGAGVYCYSSPALGTDGRLFTGSDDHNLYALTSSGALSWSYNMGAAAWDRIRGDACIDDGYNIYVGTMTANFYRFTSEGAFAWSYALSPGEFTPAIGADGRIYVGGAGDNLYALRSDGSLLWSYEAGNSFSYSSAAVDDEGRVYAGSYDYNLYGLLSDGSLLWSYKTGYYFYAGPAIASERTLYAPGVDNVLYCFRDPTPTPTATPLPNYVDLGASPGSVSPGGTESMSWRCDFSRWDYEGVPVDVYIAAIRDPRVADGPSSKEDALAGGAVYLAGKQMKDWYLYEGAVKYPTYENVSFPPVALTGTKPLAIPNNPALAGDWVFATAFIRRDNGQFVRPDGKPVENSNIFSIR